jgi:ankyrin repeat protein
MRGTRAGICAAAALTMVWTTGVAGASTPESALTKAVKARDAKAVRLLITQHAKVNALEPDGSTPLHYAANLGDLELVDLLLHAGANAKVANLFGVTPLSLACMNGSATVVERLLKAGADPNTTMSGGETALMTAARTGTPGAVKALIEAGADVNAAEPTRKQTALMWASARGNAEAAKVLLQAGANVHAQSLEKDFRGRFTGNGGAGHVKLEKDIQFTPLMFAVREGHQGVVTVLLDGGADPKETLPDGTSAVVLAIINAHWELANYLLDRGADPNAAGQGWTALHQVARSRSLTIGHVPQPVADGHIASIEVAKKLIEKGVHVNARMTSEAMKNDGYRTDMPRLGATAYLLACKGVDHELMKLLLASGADPKIPNNAGMTPLMVAAGVALHAPGEDSGTDEDAFEAVKVALAADPEGINKADAQDETPMHGAAHRGAIPVIQLLIDRGARLDAKLPRVKFKGQTYPGDKNAMWTPLTIALGREKSGTPIFLGEQRNLDAALVIYKAMRTQHLTIDEDPRSIATLDQMLAKEQQASARLP